MDDYVTGFFILIILVGLIGLVSNIIVIIVYSCDKKLRSFTNYFFVNLSIVDILIVVLCLPVGLSDMYNDGRWILGRFVCLVEFFVENVFMSVSSLTLISISIGRFFATKHPLHVRRFSTKKLTICVIGSVWFVSMVLSSPMVFYTKYGSYNNSGEIMYYCYIDRTSAISIIYRSTFTSLILFAPTLILTFVYVGIIRNLRMINKRYSSPDFGGVSRKPLNYEVVFRPKTCEPNEDPSIKVILLNRGRMNNGVDPKVSYEEIKRSFCTKNLIKKRRQTIILCTVAMTFYFCQMPIKLFQIFNLFYEWSSTGDQDKFKLLNIIFLTTKLIYCFHPMSNPIIYNLMSSKFSRSYRKVLLCKSLSGSYSINQKPNAKICFKSMSNNSREPAEYDNIKTNTSSKKPSLKNKDAQRDIKKRSDEYD